MGDQGFINYGPRSSSGNPSAVSIMRNFSLNVTDNNSPLLQNRLIPIEYYHFFDSNRVYPGLPVSLGHAGVPNRFAAQIHPSLYSTTSVRTNDDRYVFGFEALLGDRMSLLVRQSVVTIAQPDLTLQRGLTIHKLGGVRSGWSDLQLSPKCLLYQDDSFVLSGGSGLIIPVGSSGAYHQFGNSAVVFEPYLLFLAQPTERVVLQGGIEYDVPAANNLANVSLLRWETFAAYRAYFLPGSRGVESIYPLIELHGSHLVGGYTQTTVNLTAGLRINAFGRYQFGIAYSVPVTDQQQFSNEILVNVNYFF